MSILVTGASGFLGTVLCAALERNGQEIVQLNSHNCDLTNANSLLQFNKLKYTHIYHLAAWTQAGDFCLMHPGEQWIINQQINTNVLEFWSAQQPQAKLISMGTSCAYDAALPLVEENYLVGSPIESLFTYAMTKRMLYVGQFALAKQFGLKFFAAVPSTLYGPGYHTDGRQMHFIFDLIRKILRAKFYGEPVVLWGDGQQKRELVFAEDFVRVLLQLNDTTENELINIGAGTEFPIREFAAAICSIVQYPVDAIQYDKSRYVGAKSKCLEIGKLRKRISNLNLTPLETGLQKTISWFIDNRQKLLPPPARREVA